MTPYFTVHEARAIAETPWYIRSILEASFKGSRSVSLNFNSTGLLEDARQELFKRGFGTTVVRDTELLVLW